ncbi:MAG: tetratricopeptide repeat protein [Desulfobacteraceae bacterium]
MAEEKFRRKLTAILSADVAGYSRLMEEDELVTIETLTSHKEIMRKLIRQYRGRVVDSTGDNLLAEFGSVVDAVQCAVEVQQVLSAKNETLPENRRMYFRIGINLGDVVEEGERIYGDGVNVAARVESLAEGGGISISGTAYDQLGKKLPLGYEYLGEQSVKNIEKPVRVYRILTEAEAAGKVIGEIRPKTKQLRGVAIGAVAVLVIVAGALAIWNFYLRPPFEPASEERMAFPLPDNPSIAVLPFVNMSEDPKQEYFSDGLTDQIISGLSRVPNLFVIARNSTFTYKGKPVKVQKVAEDLGVKYVLEGSVQKTTDRIRITAQLIDATTGHHRWSKRYDRDLKDIFAIQDDITLELMKAMAVELRGDQARTWLTHVTTKLEAYEKYLEGILLMGKKTKGDNAKARQIYKEAIALDSQFATAYATLAWTHFWDARFGWTESRAESLETAFKFAQKALEIDDTTDLAHSVLSAIYVVKRQHEKSVAAAEKALTLNPNGALENCTLGAVIGASGRWEDSVLYCKKSVRLDPFAPPPYFHWLGRAYFMTGKYDEAIQIFKRILAIAPNYLPAHAFLAASYISLGRESEAIASAEEVLRINPKFCLESYAKTLPYKNKADIERYMAALRKAGLPETPPLPLPDKPSIAVLPFVNMSGDPEQEYFSDGMTEEIITALSKTPTVFVIARTSSFKYKGKEVDVRMVGRELGVRYVLEGSVRRSQDQLRITAQLVDAKTGNHLWAERWDRELKDIFEIQDEITMKILTSLQVKLTMGEHARRLEKGTDNLEAYLKLLQARAYYQRGNKEDNILARQLLEEAIALDPRYPPAYVLLGFTHLRDARRRWSKSPEQSLARVVQLAQKTLAIDDSRYGPHVLLGLVYILRRQHEKAIAEMEQAVALAPSSDRVHAFLSRALYNAGRSDEAIPLLKKALRRNPEPESWMLYWLGEAYAMTGRYEEAIAACKEAIKIAPRHEGAQIALTSAYSLSGREQEARTQAEEVLRINPKYCIRRGKAFFKNPSDTELVNNALRKAGLPDCPPRQATK